MILFKNLLLKQLSLRTGKVYIKTQKLVKFHFSAIRLITNKQKPENINKKKENMEHFKSNPYFSKYEEKLKIVYERNPAIFEDKFGNIKNKNIQSDVKDSKMAYSLTKKRSLDSIMKTNMLEGHTRDDVKKIWLTYMEERSRLADTMTKDDFEFLNKRSEKFKTFLFPLPRKDSGYEFFVCQWSNNECHLTPLINFQAYGENAPSAMSMVYFDELINNIQLDLVLIMSEWDEKILTRDETKTLMDQIRIFYLNRDESDNKYKLMSSFCERPSEFKHMDLIKQWETEKNKGFEELD